jgi:hypothetical protein
MCHSVLLQQQCDQVAKVTPRISEKVPFWPFGAVLVLSIRGLLPHILVPISG